MRIIILGAGSVGLQVARQLVSEHKDVVIIEQNGDTVRLAGNTLDCLVVQAQAADSSALRGAGAGQADFIIALTGSDEANMIACSIAAREFPKPRKIARVRTQAYSTFLANGASAFFGIDHVINPEVEAAQAILSAIEHGAESSVMDLGVSGLHLQSLRINGESLLAGRSILEIRRQLGHEFLIPVIVRGTDVRIPSGATVVEEGDEVSLLADEATLGAVFASLGRPWAEFGRIAIFGGGRVGSHLAGELLRRQPRGFLQRAWHALNPAARSITVYEQSIEKCKALAALYPSILVNHVDVSEELDHIDAAMAGHDLAVAVTGNQELNLVTAADAKIRGVRKSIALVIKNDYLHIARHMPIDVTVSRKATVARSVLGIIRRGILRSIQSVGEAQLEIMELTITGSSGLAGRSIREAGLPRDCLVLFVVRGGQTLLPDGSLVLQEADELGIIARREAIPRLEERFLLQA
jgi:trk system potassium uptake protein TrkA